MNQNAGFKPWENPKKIMIHIAAGFAHVGRVYEENIVRFQAVEYIKGNVLHFLIQQAGAW